jgi:magnesium-transporting ATPase (P-type)
MARGIAGGTYSRTDEIAFDSDRKRYSTLHVTPAGQVLYCKGALEAILPLCTEVETGGGAVALTAAERERLLTSQLLMRAYLFLGVLEAAAAMAAFFFVLMRGGWHYGEPLAATAELYLTATTACFAAIVVMQVVNVFVCRDARRSVFTSGIFGNRLLLWGIAFEVVLAAAIVYTPPGQEIFGTAPLDVGIWLFMLPFALVLLLLEEARKWVVRRRIAAES